jgi:hypothetical protein
MKYLMFLMKFGLCSKGSGGFLKVFKKGNNTVGFVLYKDYCN